MASNLKALIQRKRVFPRSSAAFVSVPLGISSIHPFLENSDNWIHLGYFDTREYVRMRQKGSIENILQEFWQLLASVELDLNKFLASFTAEIELQVILIAVNKES